MKSSFKVLNKTASVSVLEFQVQAILESNSVTDVQTKKEHKIDLLCVQ